MADAVFVNLKIPLAQIGSKQAFSVAALLRSRARKYLHRDALFASPRAGRSAGVATQATRRLAMRIVVQSYAKWRPHSKHAM